MKNGGKVLGILCSMEDSSKEKGKREQNKMKASIKYQLRSDTRILKEFMDKTYDL